MKWRIIISLKIQNLVSMSYHFLPSLTKGEKKKLENEFEIEF